jgi:hypothetical protein
MTQTTKNIQEIIEHEPEYEQALQNRTKNIRNFSERGPPDMCYLTKEYQKSLSLSKTNKVGFYHYVYGYNMSNPACMSTYISDVLKQQETDSNWFSSGKWVIKNAVFCVFDAFNRVDIRAEVKFPGGIKLYAVTKEEESIMIDETKWDGAYISSVLRALAPERVACAKFYKEFPNIAAWNDFSRVVVEFVRNNDLEFDSQDQLYFKGNKIVHYVIEYLVKKRRLNQAMDFLKALTDVDQKYRAFFSDVFACMNKIPETIKCISPVLEKNPHIAVLLYTQALNLMKCEKYEMALKLTKVVVQLAPDSFDAWLLLIEIYFYCKCYSEALIAINIAPIYTKPETNNGYLEIKTKNYSKPKRRETSDDFTLFMFEPTLEVSKTASFNEEMAMLQGDINEEGEQTFYNLKKLPAAKLEEQELKLYKILVKMEREMGWDRLLTLRSKLFLMEYDGGIGSSSKLDVKLKKAEDYEIYDQSMMLDESTVQFGPGSSMNEHSFIQIRQGGEKIVEQRMLEDYDSDDSNDDKELPSFLKQEDGDSITLKKSINNIQEVTYKNLQGWENERPQKITEEPEEQYETDVSDKFRKYGSKKKFKDRKLFQSNTAPFDPKTILDFDTKRKRLCSRTLDLLFVSLYEDLTMLYEWQSEENQEKNPLHAAEEEGEEEREKLGGVLWVHRGILAERLCRTRYAERAFRKAIERGTSMYAWCRLYHMYVESGSARAAMVCLAEILDEMETNGVAKFTLLPGWIEDPIFQIVSQVGVGKFKQLLQEMNWEDEALKLILDEGQAWTAEGWNRSTPLSPTNNAPQASMGGNRNEEKKDNNNSILSNSTSASSINQPHDDKKSPGLKSAPGIAAAINNKKDAKSPSVRK